MSSPKVEEGGFLGEGGMEQEERESGMGDEVEVMGEEPAGEYVEVVEDVYDEEKGEKVARIGDAGYYAEVGVWVDGECHRLGLEFLKRERGSFENPYF